MFQAGLIVGYTLFLWWLSTGIILYLDRLSPSTYRWSLLGATAILIPAVVGLSATRAGSEGASDAVCAFSCALVIWGWHEMSFLMGHITGPRTEDCPVNARGSERFLLAAKTLIYHEAAVAVTIAAVAWLTWGHTNQIGLETLMLLWGMRLSTKLNLFLGVPRHHEDMLPDHLAFLKSYFRHSSMNWLFPISITGGTVLTGMLLQAAWWPTTSAFASTGYALLGTLSALGTIEHWFLVVPLPDEALWAWAKPRAASRKGAKPERTLPHPDLCAGPPKLITS